MYIGYTSKDPYKRWKDHIRDSLRGSNRAFHVALRKYSLDKWHFLVLEKDLSLEEAKDREKFWIASMGTQMFSHEKTIGYNMTSGGDGAVGFIPSLETRAKMSASAKGKIKSETHRKNLSLANKGKKRSIETRQKISVAKRGRSNKPLSEDAKRKVALNQPNRKPVDQFDLDGNFIASFESVQDAKRATKCLNIVKCCQGLITRSGKYQWRYKQ